MLQIYVCTLERDREIFCPLVYSTNACSKQQPGARNSIQTPDKCDRDPHAALLAVSGCVVKEARWEARPRLDPRHSDEKVGISRSVLTTAPKGVILM